MPQYTVTFYPENVRVIAQEGDNLLALAKRANVSLASACGGNGACGKCKVIIRKGEIHTNRMLISPRERAQGYVLACQTVVQSNLEVEIPPESQSEDEQVLVDAEQLVIDELRREAGITSAEEMAETAYLTMATKVHLALPTPTLEDNMDDSGRLLREIRKWCQIPTAHISLANLKRLGRFLRENNWDITALIARHDQTFEIASLEPGDTSSRNYGVAVDVGTTTVVAHLVNLATRETVGTIGKANSQSSFGDDVISRIIYASKKDGLELLHKTLVDDINRLITYLTRVMILFKRGFQLNVDDVNCVMCAGNTTMTHLLLGVDPTSIRREPYVPVANLFPTIRAAEVGIQIDRRGILSCIPGVSGYVGGDTVAGSLVCGISESEDICLFIDIGTNGEIVLGNEEWLVCCSCSCGPAFEGSGIEHGMRAARGAIQRVAITELYDVRLSTIGNDKVRGICGSGLIDALGEMLRSGVIDKAGKIVPDLNNPRLKEEDEGLEFVLAWKDETAGQHDDITISQADIDNLMRAKAAVYAAARVLMEKVSVTWRDIKRIYIAGAFGNYLDIEKAIFIGLLPDIPLEKFRFIGNSSIAGAKLAMLSGLALAKAEDIANKMTYIELSNDNDFFEQFVAATFLPHTHTDLFPSVIHKLGSHHP